MTSAPRVAVYRNAKAERPAADAQFDWIIRNVRDGHAASPSDMETARALYAAERAAACAEHGKKAQNGCVRCAQYAAARKRRAAHKEQRFRAITPAGAARGRTTGDFPSPHSAVVQIDIDKLADSDLDRARQEAEADRSVACAFTSVSGAGLSVFVRVARPSDADGHRAAWDAVRAEWERRGYEVDTPGNAFNALRFLPNDPLALLWRPADPVLWTPAAPRSRPAGPHAPRRAGGGRRRPPTRGGWSDELADNALQWLRERSSGVEWEDWYQTGIAIKAAGGSVEDWRQLFAGSVKYDERDYTEKRFAGFRAEIKGLGGVVSIARKYGWRPPEPVVWVGRAEAVVDWSAHTCSWRNSRQPCARCGAGARQRTPPPRRAPQCTDCRLLSDMVPGLRCEEHSR